MSNKSKYFVLSGEALDLLKEFNEVLTENIEGTKKLQEEFESRSQQMHTKHNAELRALWFKMAPLVGLDAEATWHDRSYSVDTRYIDEGFGTIVFSPQASQSHPFTALFGVPQTQEEKTEQPIVDPKKLN